MIAELQTAIENTPARRRVNDQLTDADKMKIIVERQALLLRGAPTAIVTSAILAIFTLAVGLKQVAPTVISIWAGLVVGLAIVRLFLWRHYTAKKNAGHALSMFVKLHIGAMVVNGALWGALAPIFTVYGSMGNAYLPFIIAGMTAATISSAGASWRAVLAFNVPALIPFAGAYALMADPDSLAIAGVVVTYLCATAFLAVRTQEMIVRSIRLRSRNANLLKALSNQMDAAHEAELRFRALVESSKDVTLVFSPDGKVTYASPSAEKIFGIPPKQLVGMSTKEIVHPDDFQIFKAVGERSLSNLGEVIPLAHVCFKSVDDTYAPVAGRLTNMMYVPGVEGFVFNGGRIDEANAPHLHAAE